MWIESEDIGVRIYEDDDGYSGDPADEMEDQLFEDELFTSYAPIERIEVNGLAAYEVKYHDSSNDYYEVWIELPDENCAKLYVQGPIGQAENMKKQAQVKKLLGSILGDVG